jgi:hypothetical protein
VALLREFGRIPFVPETQQPGSYEAIQGVVHATDWETFMGSTIKASCRCGFRTENLLVGGGMFNFTYYCACPAYCKKCEALTLTNLLAVPHTCERCGSEVLPYNSPELRATQGGEVVESWNVPEGEPLILTADEHFCPACRTYHMRFEPGDICWD